jgi:hypothetical protein
VGNGKQLGAYGDIDQSLVFVVGFGCLCRVDDVSRGATKKKQRNVVRNHEEIGRLGHTYSLSIFVNFSCEPAAFAVVPKLQDRHNEENDGWPRRLC